MAEIHERLPLTELPSWVNPVPRDVGTKSQGKLSADQWHMFCVINLPIVLIQLWAEKGGVFKCMLDNYMHLVTEVIIGGLLEMSEDAIELYESAALAYLTSVRELYGIQLTPNHHNSLHIPLFLHFFGPLHAIRMFWGERMNNLLQQVDTSLKFLFVLVISRLPPDTNYIQTGELEQTSVLAARKENPLILDEECFRALIAHLNSRAGREVYVDVRRLRRDPDLHQLWNDAFHVPSVYVNGVSFRCSRDSSTDSNVMYWADSSQTKMVPGRIQSIFSYAHRDLDGCSIEGTYLSVLPYAELSEQDLTHDVFRTYPYVGGRLYYDRHLPMVVISLEEVVSHFARTPVKIAEIPTQCVHVLSLDKVSSLTLSHHPHVNHHHRV